jgi:thioredoxin reductase (NADPH)
VVVGGGDAALTESAFLTRVASSIKLVHRRTGFRAQVAYVNEARESAKIEFVLNTVLTEIRGEGKVESVLARNVKSGETSEIECEGVFIFIGHDPNTQFLKSVLPEHAGGIIPVDVNMETSVKGLYAVGDVRVGSYRQVGTAIGDAIAAAMHGEKRMKELLGQAG